MSPLTFENAAALLSYDPNTGVLTWKQSRGRCKAGSVAGSPTNHGAVSVHVCGKRYYGHRLAWLLMTGKWPSVLIDHKDMTPSNNRWVNLREATHSQNHANADAHRDHNLPRGVSFDKRKAAKPFSAKICVQGRTICLGVYPTSEEAHAAYRHAAKTYFGEFTRAA